MNGIDAHLTALFDEIAASIDPKPDFDAVVHGAAATGTVAGSTIDPRGGRSFRRGLAVAAAAVVVLGGAAAAFQLDREPSMVATDDVTAPTTIDSTLLTPTSAAAPASDKPLGASEIAPTPASGDVGVPMPARTAELGAGRLDTEPIRQIVRGGAMPGEQISVTTPYGGADATAGADGRWKVVLELAGVPATTLVPIDVLFENGTMIELTIVTPHAAPVPEPKPEPEPAPDTTVAVEQPKPEPTPEPKPEPKEQPPAAVDFTAALGAGYPDASPMKQVVHGTATPGTKVLVTSAYGHSTVEAGKGGTWEAHLKMYDVPAGTDVRIAVTANGFSQQFEFWVRRPHPAVKPFTAGIAATYLEGDPIKVVFQGTGTPGSKVTASADYGSAGAVVADGGGWELRLLMHAVPAGTNVGIRVTDTSSGATKDFTVTTPHTPAPTHHFKAHAAYTECDWTPPYNDYWGTATPGATITIGSPYGGTQVSADQAGAWSARVEFSTAPVGEKFQVSVTSSKNDQVFTFGFKRIAPA